MRRFTWALSLGLFACSGSISPSDGDGNGPGKPPAIDVDDPPDVILDDDASQAIDPGEVADLGGTTLDELCDKAGVGRARIWRLTAPQIRNTLKDALDIEASDSQLAAFNDSRGLVFDNEADALSLRKADAASWALSATALSATALPALAEVCPDAKSAACAKPMVSFLAPRLFRRPLTSAESERYEALYGKTLAATDNDGDAAKSALVVAMLQSPFFLYRSELGQPVKSRPGLVRLTQDELASALAYTFWQTAPDAQLRQAAADGALNDVRGLRVQAERLVNDPRFLRFYTAMVADLTKGSRMASREGSDEVKDANQVIALLQDELAAYVGGVVRGEGTLKALLTQTQVPTSATAAAFRNLAAATDMKTLVLPAKVAGVLSLGAVSFANAGTSHPSPIKRGVMVREHFLCSPIPPPPPNIKQEIAPREGNILTNRQAYEATTNRAECIGCHRLFNPLGYAFEAFDELGRYRENDGGEPLDLSGSVPETREGDLSFKNLADLATQMATLDQVTECFALNGFRFVAGRLESKGDYCHVRDIHQRFMAANGDLKVLALELVTSDAFAYRVTDLN